MSRKSDLSERLKISQKVYVNILDAHDLQTKSTINLINDLEKFEYLYCKDSLAQELGLNQILNLKHMKNVYRLMASELRKLSLLRAKHSLAFDLANETVESRKESEL